MTKKYQLYIVKKFYEPITIEANDSTEAEEKAYDFINQNNEDNRYTSDDTYIYFDGEAE